MSLDLLLIPNAKTAGWPGEGFPARPLRTRTELRDAFVRTARRRKPALWIADHSEQVSHLAAEPPLRVTNARLLILTATHRMQRDLLQIVFRIVLAPGDGVHLLGLGALKDVLAAPNREDLLLGGAIDRVNEVVRLYRGNLEPVVVPFAWFGRRGAAPRPNFGEFEITDHGQTVRLGRYEAATDAILYTFDPAYRRAAKERLVRADPSFGGSLRRLRLLKGVARDDFPGISEKQIARIERGEIRRPHASTVAAIATRLGVDAAEIGSY